MVDRRRLLTSAVAACAVLACMLDSPAINAAPTPAVTAAPAGTPTASYPSAEERLRQRKAAAQAQADQRVWWNQPDMIKSLQLSDSQRASLDKLMDKALENQAQAQREQISARQTFEQALAAGDWAAARDASVQLNKATADMWGAQTDLKIDALQVLDETQRQTLMQNPLLVRRPWGVGLHPGGVHIQSAPAPLHVTVPTPKQP